MAVTPIFRIQIGERHRKDLGDLQSLADSIAQEGLLQPIGLTRNFDLVFGERRLRACRDFLGWVEIDTRFVEVSSIVAGEFHENEIRKAFTPSERVAIEQAMNKFTHGGDRKSDQAQNLAVDRNKSAQLAGFGNRETARQARKVVERGTSELISAMDKGEISINAAAEIAGKSSNEQQEQLKLPTRKEAIEEAKHTGTPVLAKDGRYHEYTPPERQAQVDIWLKSKGVLWALADMEVDPAAMVAAVPPKEREAFEVRLRRAEQVISALRTQWEKSAGRLAAE
jgi:ParB-like chromosome segregation protein Spo0J